MSMPVLKIHPNINFALLRRYLFAVLIAALFLAACAANKDNLPGLSLTGADSGSTIKAAVSQCIDIKLQTVGPGQYETPIISSSSVKFLSSELLSPAIPAGPTQLYKFQAVAPGTATIEIPHSVRQKATASP